MAPRGGSGRASTGRGSSLAKKVFVKEKDPVTGEVTRKNVPLLRFFTVFNAAQADGLPAKYYPEKGQPVEQIKDGQEVIDTYLDNGGPKLSHEAQNRAYYRLADDSITLPEKEQFKSAEGYYATAFHELGHSTGHPGRLNREAAQHYGEWKFGDKIYAREELVAEMTSAMLQAAAGIESEEQLDQSASYVDNWLGALDKDPQLVSHAASQASKAADLILDQRQGEHDDQAEAEADDQPQRQAA
jgi:putative DNA primase/helicase